MAKYHIKKDGTPGVCHAQNGNCPLGGAEAHFSTPEQAQAAADERNMAAMINTSSNTVVSVNNASPTVAYNAAMKNLENPDVKVDDFDEDMNAKGYIDEYKVGETHFAHMIYDYGKKAPDEFYEADDPTVDELNPRISAVSRVNVKLQDKDIRNLQGIPAVQATRKQVDSLRSIAALAQPGRDNSTLETLAEDDSIDTVDMSREKYMKAYNVIYDRKAKVLAKQTTQDGPKMAAFIRKNVPLDSIRMKVASAGGPDDDYTTAAYHASLNYARNVKHMSDEDIIKLSKEKGLVPTMASELKVSKSQLGFPHRVTGKFVERVTGEKFSAKQTGVSKYSAIAEYGAKVPADKFDKAKVHEALVKYDESNVNDLRKILGID